MDKDYTPKQYEMYVSQKAPKSPILKDCLLAFAVGGGICLIGQILLNIYESCGMEQKMAFTLVSMTLIFIGAFLTGIQLYSKLGKYAGAGSIVPISGFANSIVSPAMEFKTEGLVLGLAAKMFAIAGPVIVYGVLSSVIVGLVYYFLR